MHMYSDLKLNKRSFFPTLVRRCPQFCNNIHNNLTKIDFTVFMSKRPPLPYDIQF